ncbi:MAG TPA: MmcQ/YjbR family DNA-binding protein [Acidimicrobiales bacterium]|jgi:predicted DNA-binding protein (MmcQ/YjbR family)|nr:MmcQ/YjbR family DNA-binding protein [Acidimicrobiales bacterium]
MARRPIDRLRSICLALPESYEETTWGDATFRVRKKIFAGAADNDAGCSVSLKADRAEQAALLAQGPPFFLPAYVGSKGWIGVDLASPNVDWDEVNELVRESYRLVAPKGLAAHVE